MSLESGMLLTKDDLLFHWCFDHVSKHAHATAIDSLLAHYQLFFNHGNDGFARYSGRRSSRLTSCRAFIDLFSILMLEHTLYLAGEHLSGTNDDQGASRLETVGQDLQILSGQVECLESCEGLLWSGASACLTTQRLHRLRWNTGSSQLVHRLIGVVLRMKQAHKSRFVSV